MKREPGGEKGKTWKKNTFSYFSTSVKNDDNTHTTKINITFSISPTPLGVSKNNLLNIYHDKTFYYFKTFSL